MLNVMPEITEAIAHVCLNSQAIHMALNVYQVRNTAEALHTKLASYLRKIFLVIPIEADPGCIEDAECPSRHACFSGECENPCTRLRPCATNAICTVYDDLPRRTMTCVCKPGYTGKGDVRCDPIGKLHRKI